MSDFPTKKRIIRAMEHAMKKPYWSVDDVFSAMMRVLPKCEDHHSAAYCYEKLEDMRDE